MIMAPGLLAFLQVSFLLFLRAIEQHFCCALKCHEISKYLKCYYDKNFTPHFASDVKSMFL